MSTTAPKPPTKRLFAATFSTGSAALGMTGLLSVGHFAYGNIPAGRLLAYSLVVLATAAACAVLAGRYLWQRSRRDAWWDGRAACDALAAEAAGEIDDRDQAIRRLQAELEELTDAVYDLAAAAGRPRPPQPRAQPSGSTYTSRAVQGDTVMIRSQTEPAPPVQVAEKPADPIAEARVEGYVEGYADGITRRDEGTE